MDALGLSQFKIPIQKIAPLIEWKNRHGETFSYRHYPAWSENLVFLFHGIGADSKYLSVVATAISEAGVAQVVTPDLRCHGSSLGMSDLIKPDQLKIDLEELFIHLRQKQAIGNIALVGHSMGGALALKLAAEKVLPGVCGALGIVPHLPASLNLHNVDWGQWIRPMTDGRIEVMMPEAFKTGKEKLTYSREYLAATALEPQFLDSFDYRHLKVAITVAGKDPIYRNQEVQLFVQSKKDIKLCYLPEANHFSVIMKKDYLNQQVELLQDMFI